MPSLSIDEVIKHLPHRYPFLLIDRVIDYTVWESLHAMKNVSICDPWFIGHFPETPVMPGVLILEALAQSAAILAYKTMETTPDGKNLFFLAGIDNAKFKQVVKPGDQLNLHVKLEKHKRSVWKISTEAKVEGKIVCSADILSAHKEIEA